METLDVPTITTTIANSWGNTQTLNVGTPTIIELPDPLTDWLPYKWKKYLPTWHLVRSYE